jgi:hypothetical protein
MDRLVSKRPPHDWGLIGTIGRWGGAALIQVMSRQLTSRNTSPAEGCDGWVHGALPLSMPDDGLSSARLGYGR